MFLLDFLFPKTPKILELEKLSSQKLLDLLSPHSLPFDYQHPLVKEIIWEIKYKGNRTLAEKIGMLLYDSIVPELNEEKIILIPIPISGKRRFERGFNQTEIICEAIKKLDKEGRFKYLCGQLIKTIDTLSQTRTATRKERLENLRDSMVILNPEKIKGQCVVLIDDVTTTGATFTEAKRALRAAGAKKIYCFAIAH